MFLFLGVNREAWEFWKANFWVFLRNENWKECVCISFFDARMCLYLISWKLGCLLCFWIIIFGLVDGKMNECKTYKQKLLVIQLVFFLIFGKGRYWILLLKRNHICLDELQVYLHFPWPWCYFVCDHMFWACCCWNCKWLLPLFCILFLVSVNLDINVPLLSSILLKFCSKNKYYCGVFYSWHIVYLYVIITNYPFSLFLFFATMIVNMLFCFTNSNHKLMRW